MKIIIIDEKNPYCEQLYEKLYNFLFFGYEYLPFVFLKTVYLNDVKLQLPRWITKRHWDSIDKRTQKLMMELNKK